MALTEVFDGLLSKSLVGVAVVLAILYYVGRSWEQDVDRLEPPAIRAPIPYIGHVIRSMRESPSYLNHLKQEKHLPIATLPILDKKLYAIWDPHLVQAAYCNKSTSFIPFAVDNARAVTGYDEVSHQIAQQTDVLPTYFKSIYEGTTAQHIHKLNVVSLRFVSNHINEIGPKGLEVDNIYMWLRDLMTVATCEALFGPRNPIKTKQQIEDVWTFETGISWLIFHLYPSATLRNTLAARKRIQDNLAEYFEGMDHDDEEVSAYIRFRTGVLRRYGFDNRRIGDIEVALIHVPTSNSIPTLFWFLIHVFTRPELVDRIRQECEPFAVRGPDNDVTMNIDDLNEKCPLLVASFREASRICNKFVCNRRVMEDTTISDKKGNTYLLKKGANIRMPAGTMHDEAATWGADADEFRPERFLETGLSSETAKMRRAAWTPFGGGAHMCPGRNFASAEILAFVASMAVGYKVEPRDGDWSKFKPPVMDDCPVVTSVCKPADENNVFGARVTRRPGWETVNWKFDSGKLKA